MADFFHLTYVGKIATKTFILQNKPSNYKKSKVMLLQNTETTLSEKDSRDHQTKIFGFVHTDLKNNHIRELNKN